MLCSGSAYQPEVCRIDSSSTAQDDADRSDGARAAPGAIGMNAQFAVTLTEQDREFAGSQSSGAWTNHSMADSRVLLSSEELAVIAIGKKDAASFWWRGASEDRRWRIRLLMVLRATTGQRGVQSLASERLETLRLLVCMVVRQQRRVPDMRKQLIALGMAPMAVAEAVRLARRTGAAG